MGEAQYGPTTTVLQAFVWTLKCPPKIEHFIWQMITGCVSVGKNLRARGINCDTRCALCGAEEETINHVIFECPPAIQTWALSKIPTPPDIFPTSSVFTNLESLFNREPKKEVEGYFPWIIWYLWKSRNDKCFKNLNRNPQDILLLAETEGKVWTEAQKSDEKRLKLVPSHREPVQQHMWWCQVDGSWKSSDQYSGQGWVCTKGGEDEMMLGARNIRRSQSPLHAELEALIWAMECMQGLQRKEVVFITDCMDVVKMVSSPEEWPAFAVHLEELHKRKTNLRDVRVTHKSRSTNTRADILARSARQLTSEMVYVNSTPPNWLLSEL